MKYTFSAEPVERPRFIFTFGELESGLAAKKAAKKAAFKKPIFQKTFAAIKKTVKSPKFKKALAITAGIAAIAGAAALGPGIAAKVGTAFKKSKGAKAIKALKDAGAKKKDLEKAVKETYKEPPAAPPEPGEPPPPPPPPPPAPLDTQPPEVQAAAVKTMAEARETETIPEQILTAKALGFTPTQTADMIATGKVKAGENIYDASAGSTDIETVESTLPGPKAEVETVPAEPGEPEKMQVKSLFEPGTLEAAAGHQPDDLEKLKKLRADTAKSMKALNGNIKTCEKKLKTFTRKHPEQKKAAALMETDLKNARISFATMKAALENTQNLSIDEEESETLAIWPFIVAGLGIAGTATYLTDQIKKTNAVNGSLIQMNDILNRVEKGTLDPDKVEITYKGAGTTGLTITQKGTGKAAAKAAPGPTTAAGAIAAAAKAMPWIIGGLALVLIGPPILRKLRPAAARRGK